MGAQLRIGSEEAYGLAAEPAGLRGESLGLMNSMSGLDFGIVAIDTGQWHLARLASGFEKRVIVRQTRWFDASRLRRGNPGPQRSTSWRAALDCRVASAPRNDETGVFDCASVDAKIARRAKLTARKDRCPARLNFGDRFSYALA